MNQLVKTSSAIVGGEEQQTVNARELWKFLGSKRQFGNWMKDRIKEYGFIEGVDFTVNKIVNGHNKGRFTPVDYTITINMAKELAMIENNEKGKQARRYFIEVEKQYRAQFEQRKDLPSPEILMATLYTEMERRIQAEERANRYEATLRRLAFASNLTFGEISNATGLPKDIVIAPHCKSSSRPHKPQYPKFIQLVLPLQEIINEYKMQIEQ